MPTIKALTFGSRPFQIGCDVATLGDDGEIGVLGVADGCFGELGGDAFASEFIRHVSVMHDDFVAFDSVF